MTNMQWVCIEKVGPHTGIRSLQFVLLAGHMFVGHVLEGKVCLHLDSPIHETESWKHHLCTGMLRADGV